MEEVPVLVVDLLFFYLLVDLVHVTYPNVVIHHVMNYMVNVVEKIIKVLHVVKKELVLIKVFGTHNV